MTGDEVTTVWRVYESSYDDQETVAVCASYADALADYVARDASGIEKLTVGEPAEDYTPTPVLQPMPLHPWLKQWQDWGASIAWNGYSYYVSPDERSRVVVKVSERERSYPDVE